MQTLFIRIWARFLFLIWRAEEAAQIRKPYINNVRQLVNIACPSLFTILVIGRGGFV